MGLPEVKVGDLVRGGSLHNWNLIGLVVEFRPNHKEEFLVQWFAAEVKDGEPKELKIIPTKFVIEERYYDLEKIS